MCRAPPGGRCAGLGLDDHEAEDDGEAHERDARGGGGQRHALGHEGAVGAHAHAVEHAVDLDGLEQGLQARRADVELDEAVDDAVGVVRHDADVLAQLAGDLVGAGGLAHGKSLARTMRKMGYPASRECLCGWIDELAPGQRKCRGPSPKAGPVPPAEKIQAVAEPGSRSGTAAEVAEKHGVSRTAPYIWRREMMGDDAGDTEEKGVPVSKESGGLPDGIEVLQDMLRAAKMQLRKVQLELDVRQATLEIVKKDQGADPELLTNEEKAAMAEALRAEYRLCEILPVVGMAKSSYEYARNAQAGGEAEGRAAARKAVSRRPGPAAAHTATGACTPGSTPMRGTARRSASGRSAASWRRRTWSRGPPRRSGATARTRARSPRRPRTCCATSGAGTTSARTSRTSCG